MSFEISESVSHAVDVILLTFILVWRERKNERTKTYDIELAVAPVYGPATTAPGLGE